MIEASFKALDLHNLSGSDLTTVMSGDVVVKATSLWMGVCWPRQFSELKICECLTHIYMFEIKTLFRVVVKTVWETWYSG